MFREEVFKTHLPKQPAREKATTSVFRHSAIEGKIPLSQVHLQGPARLTACSLSHGFFSHGHSPFFLFHPRILHLPLRHFVSIISLVSVPFIFSHLYEFSSLFLAPSGLLSVV